MLVIVDGSSGKRYSVKFDGVTSLESCSPENMMLHALAEWESSLGALHLYEFINWHHVSQRKRRQSRSYGSPPRNSQSLLNELDLPASTKGHAHA
jgi:hypothetical protein